jgi:outer membrane murein-binding lipoprotein Lpp
VEEDEPVKETIKQRIEREVREEMDRMKNGPEVSDIDGKIAKLREDYHRKCDEVVAARENAAKAMEERDAALVKLSKIQKQVMGITYNTSGGIVRAAVDEVKDILGPGDPLTPYTQKGTAATRST